MRRGPGRERREREREKGERRERQKGVQQWPDKNKEE